VVIENLADQLAERKQEEVEMWEIELRLKKNNKNR
jgi:hypothetical protein